MSAEGGPLTEASAGGRETGTATSASNTAASNPNKASDTATVLRSHNGTSFDMGNPARRERMIDYSFTQSYLIHNPFTPTLLAVRPRRHTFGAQLKLHAIRMSEPALAPLRPNTAEFTVSELSAALKRTVEDAY